MDLELKIKDLNSSLVKTNTVLPEMTSIILLSYNTLPYTKLCIDSIRQYTALGSYEIIVVDNGSVDGSAKWLRTQSDLRCIYNKKNEGFPKGCNQGLAIARGTELLLLNNDVVVTPRWLEQMKTALYSAEKIGAVGCVTNCCSNLQQIEVSYQSLEEMQAFAAEYNQSNPQEWKRSLYLVGFCFLVKREIYERIGGLDEAFSPGNYEDNDYSLRIWEAGWSLLLCKDTFIHHFGSMSFQQSEDPELQKKKMQTYGQLGIRNEKYFLKKWGFSENHASWTALINELPEHIVKGAKILVSDCNCGLALFILEERYPSAKIYGITANRQEARIASCAFHVSYCPAGKKIYSFLQDKYDYIVLTEPFKGKENVEELRGFAEYLADGGELHFIWNQQVCKFSKVDLETYRNSEGGGNRMIFSINFADFSAKVRTIEADSNQKGKKTPLITMGPGSYLVNGILEYGTEKCHVLVGRYCSLGNDLHFVIGLNHDYHQVTSYPFQDILHPIPGCVNRAEQVNYYQIIVGNDVWIGRGVTILGGVRIGNGAVIGAGTVVTKDVPPYAVFVGNPGRVVKYRFDKELIYKLQWIKWWNWSEEKIHANLDLMRNPASFSEQFYTQKMSERVESVASDELQKLHTEGYELFYFIPDYISKMPIWKNVIQQYIKKYSATDKVALIVEIMEEGTCNGFLSEISALLDESGENAPLLVTHQDKDRREVLQNTDIFITTRDDISSKCIDYADCYHMLVHSGLDLNIFRS